MAIRPLRLRQIDAVSDLDLMFDNPISSERLRREYLAGARGLVAYEGRDLVGFALWRDRDGIRDLLRLAVAEPFRRNGIGRRLLSRVLLPMPTAPHHHILTVRKDNGPALRLYARHGFKLEGELGPHWVMRR